MMIMLNSCSKEKMPVPASADTEKDLQLARGVKPDFSTSRLICSLGNFYGDWLNYQNANASVPFDEMRFDTVEVSMPSGWNVSEKCYEVDPITQQEIYQELSTAVGSAESRVNLTGLINPHVVAVAVEILKPKITNPTDFDGYIAPFSKGELDTIYVGDQQPYRFRVITAVGAKNISIVGNIRNGCTFPAGNIYDPLSNFAPNSATAALSYKANNYPCLQPAACRYMVDVSIKNFGYDYNQTLCQTKDELFEYYNNNDPLNPSICESSNSNLGTVSNSTSVYGGLNASWMNFFLSQGQNLALLNRPTPQHTIKSYQWITNTCPCSFTHYWHNLTVTYGRCAMSIPTR